MHSCFKRRSTRERAPVTRSDDDDVEVSSSSNDDDDEKVKVNLSLCLTKHPAMKAYWGVEV
jgi:hypothetical protein